MWARHSVTVPIYSRTQINFSIHRFAVVKMALASIRLGQVFAVPLYKAPSGKETALMPLCKSSIGFRAYRYLLKLKVNFTSDRLMWVPPTKRHGKVEG